MFFFCFLIPLFVDIPGKASNVNDVYGAAKQSYATWDPRKSQAGPTYDEIPYGDGPGPRGPIPSVPQHYAQVPPVPQRQGGDSASVPARMIAITESVVCEGIGKERESKRKNYVQKREARREKFKTKRDKNSALFRQSGIPSHIKGKTNQMKVEVGVRFSSGWNYVVFF